MDLNRLGIILLAGGKSTRMGQDKGLLVLQDKPMLQHILEVVVPLQCPIIIIANQPAYQAFNYPVFADIIPDCGPMGGIYTGLMHSERPHNLVLACDMPYVQLDAIQYLIAQHSENQGVAVGAIKGQLEPLFAIYSKECLPSLEDALHNGAYKMQDYLKCEAPGVQTINLEAWQESMRNLNAPSDLQQKIKFFGMIAEATGCSALDIEPLPDAKSLLAMLYTRFPMLHAYTFAIAVDKTIAAPDQVLRPGAEIALLPPYAGG